MSVDFKLPIAGLDFDKISSLSQSQAGQDLFVIAVTQGKKHGRWLELGCGPPKKNSNTYLLEKEFSWTGVSIDLREQQEVKKELWNVFWNNVKDPSWGPAPESIDDLSVNIQKELIDIHRYHDFIPGNWHDRPRATLVVNDALALDYSFLPDQIDYLQVDIDPPMANYMVLEKVIPRCKFSAITFEHDLWRNTEEVKQVRENSRIFLQNHGYEMIVNDVTVPLGKGTGIEGQPVYFEDWWVHPDLIGSQIRAKYKSISTRLYPKFYQDILFET